MTITRRRGGIGWPHLTGGGAGGGDIFTLNKYWQSLGCVCVKQLKMKERKKTRQVSHHKNISVVESLVPGEKQLEETELWSSYDVPDWSSVQITVINEVISSVFAPLSFPILLGPFHNKPWGGKRGEEGGRGWKRQVIYLDMSALNEYSPNNIWLHSESKYFSSKPLRSKVIPRSKQNFETISSKPWEFPTEQTASIFVKRI